MRKTFFIIAGLIFITISFVPVVSSEQRESRYVTLKYSSKEILRTFNDHLSLGSSLSRMMTLSAWCLIGILWPSRS